MLYEKKMLILSGDGKGVVLIEKSAHGVKFTLRTFDMPPCAQLKAGIVTKSAVFVRDLPQKDNPAVVFTLESAELDSLHFAVFDRELRLYGSTGKRMWESNLMDLLAKHEKRAPMLDGVPHAPLPPIAKQPQVLPMPDGSGIPQSRIAVYGDDALAENDFYTHLDFSERMPVVDGFLDTPRTLDELAPRIRPSASSGDPIGIELPTLETTEIEPDDKNDGQSSDDNNSENGSGGEERDEAALGYDPHDFDGLEITLERIAVDDQATGDEIKGADVMTESDNIDKPTETAHSAVVAEPNASVEKTPTDGDSTVTANADGEAAASADFAVLDPNDSTIGDMPWESEARWIKKRGGRELTERRARVRQMPACEKLKRLRATEFFERARRDIEILFASAARDEALSGLIDDVEWVKVDVDGNTVSVGRSGNAFLCYAVAGTYERTPPLGDEAQWVPRDRNVPTGKGYWVIFQNLSTGEIIKG